MAKRLQYRRLLVLGLLLGIALASLTYKLVDLQVVRHDELSARSEQDTHRQFLLQPRRGDIVDAKGDLLATSVTVKMVCADPSLLAGRHAEVAHALAPLLELNEAKLLQSLTPRLRQTAAGETATNRYIVLKHRVPVETWEKIQAVVAAIPAGLDEKTLSKGERASLRDLRQKAVFTRDEQMRVYPAQSLAAHVLGFTSAEERLVNGLPLSEITGQEGIERSFNSKLAGVRGWRQTETDRQRREMVTMREEDVEARDGFNVVLTIDSVLQHIMESALAEAMEKHQPLSISGLMIRPRTGEILAMATLPTFDPNKPGQAKADERRNRVITDVAEPGSTFKIVVVSGALNDGTVRLTDTFDCEHGAFAYAGRVLHDHDQQGVLSVEKIITHSSNIGAAKIGIKMGPDRLYDYIRNFGFGTRSGLPLPGEVGGIAHPVKDWSKVSLAQIPMGQGIAVTRLQMVMAMCALANKGSLMRPMLVSRLEDGKHNAVAKFYPQRMRQVVSEAAAAMMVQALKTVVSPDGTAPKARLERYSVAGKTGTAEKVENGVYVRKYFSSFIGFFPADNPELCIGISMDEPKQGYYGGQTAAPVFKQIAEQAANYLNIRPDNAEESTTPSPVLSVTDDRAEKKTIARAQ